MIHSAFMWMPLPVRLFLAPLLLATASLAISAQKTPTTFTSPDAMPATLDEIASKLAMRAEKMGCDTDRCSLLVTDLVTNSGSTSPLGLRVSDKFADLLSKSLKKGNIVDRSLLHQFLNRERIPSKVMAETVATAWLGKELGATVVLSGDIDVVPSVPQAMFILVNVNSPKEPDLFGTELPLPPLSDSDLQSEDAFGPLSAPAVTKDGAALYRPGTPGVSLPTCKRMENPSYTDEARAAKIKGSIMLDAVVETDGSVRDPRILQGLPFGLNQAALAAVRAWRCSPGQKDGRSVPVLASFEINFHIN